LSRLIRNATLAPAPYVVGMGEQYLPPELGLRGRTAMAPGDPRFSAHVEELLANARAQASRIIDEANLQAARIEREAYQKGWQQGVEEGAKAARGELRGHLETVRKIATQASVDREEMVKNSEKAVVRLAMEIAKRILQRELSVDPAVVARVVASAITKVNATDVIKVRANPKDLDMIRGYLGETPRQDGQAWEVVADPRVQPGGCIIDTRVGMLDAQLDAQLKEIEESFQELDQPG